MSIRQLGNKAPEQTTRPVNNTKTDTTQEQRHSSSNDRNRQPEEELHDDIETLKSVTANPFGNRNSPTHLLSSLAKYAQAFIANRSRATTFKLAVIVVENDVEVPGIVIANVTETEDANKQKYDTVVGHTIMLADYNLKPEPLDDVREGSRTIYSTTVWADGMDEDYLDAIAQSYIEQHDATEARFIDAGNTVFDYKDIPLEQLNSERHVQIAELDNMLLMAMTVAEAKRALESGETDTAVRPGLVPPGYEIVADINLTPNTSQTAGGTPVAEDFRITVKQVKTNTRYQYNQQEERKGMNKRGRNTNEWAYGAISGRIDFMYVIPRSEQSSYIRDPRPEDSACFIPEFIATGFDIMDRAPSLSLLMQLVASVGMLGDRDPAIYLAAFKPENVAQTPSRKLGALAAKLKDPKTGKLAKRVDFRPNTPESEFDDFVQCSILPEYRIGIEVPSQGPLVTLQVIFQRAALYAAGYKEYKPENDMLIDAFNQLTGGLFGEAWTSSDDAIMLPEIVSIPGGYWTDERGHKRDSREVTNYVYLANLENPKEALDMSDDYLASFNIKDEIIASNKRLDLITQIKGQNFVQTDNFKRCYFATDAYGLLLETMHTKGTSVATPRMSFGGRIDDRRRIDTVGGRISRDTLSRGYRRQDSGRNERSDRRDSTERTTGRGYGSSRR